MNKLLPVFCLFFMSSVFAQHPGLRERIAAIAGSSSGKVGVAISLLESKDTVTFQNHDRYVLHSVLKFATGMKILSEVDKGRWKLDQKIHITREDLRPTYSPLRDKYPNGNVD